LSEVRIQKSETTLGYITFGALDIVCWTIVVENSRSSCFEIHTTGLHGLTQPIRAHTSVRILIFLLLDLFV
jgi:hypothetical protein